jgi:hypothetical protein
MESDIGHMDYFNTWKRRFGFAKPFERIGRDIQHRHDGHHQPDGKKSMRFGI